MQRHHGPALQAFELLHELVEQPGVLDASGYSAEQVATTVAPLSTFSGTLWGHVAWAHASPTLGRIASRQTGERGQRRLSSCSRCSSSYCVGDYHNRP
jgi:hypothetical protein